MEQVLECIFSFVEYNFVSQIPTTDQINVSRALAEIFDSRAMKDIYYSLCMRTYEREVLIDCNYRKTTEAFKTVTAHPFFKFVSARQEWLTIAGEFVAQLWKNEVPKHGSEVEVHIYNFVGWICLCNFLQLDQNHGEKIFKIPDFPYTIRARFHYAPFNMDKQLSCSSEKFFIRDDQMYAAPDAVCSLRSKVYISYDGSSTSSGTIINGSFTERYMMLYKHYFDFSDEYRIPNIYKFCINTVLIPTFTIEIEMVCPYIRSFYGLYRQLFITKQKEKLEKVKLFWRQTIMYRLYSDVFYEEPGRLGFLVRWKGGKTEASLQKIEIGKKYTFCICFHTCAIYLKDPSK